MNTPQNPDPDSIVGLGAQIGHISGEMLRAGYGHVPEPLIEYNREGKLRLRICNGADTWLYRQLQPDDFCPFDTHEASVAAAKHYVDELPSLPEGVVTRYDDYTITVLVDDGEKFAMHYEIPDTLFWTTLAGMLNLTSWACDGAMLFSAGDLQSHDLLFTYGEPDCDDRPVTYTCAEMLASAERCGDHVLVAAVACLLADPVSTKASVRAKPNPLTRATQS